MRRVIPCSRVDRKLAGGLGWGDATTAARPGGRSSPGGRPAGGASPRAGGHPDPAVGGGGRLSRVEPSYDYLLIFDSAGKFLLPIGGTGREVGQFFLPAGVWTDDRRRVYVADMFNGRIIVLSELTGLEAGQ